MTDFPDRREMLAKVHIARKDLGLDDDTYRDVLTRVTGRESSAACTRPQIVDLLDEFQRLGWKSGPVKKRFEGSSKSHVRKVWAIWSQMCRDGVPDNPTRVGLVAFVRRMAGVDDPEWLTPEQARSITEGLKAWETRVRKAKAGGK